MNCLFIINEAPGHERAFNALRLATTLTSMADIDLRLFFLGDGVGCVVQGQAEPANGQNIEWLLRRLLASRPEAAACRTCLDARGISDGMLLDGLRRGSLEELAIWTFEADRLLVF